jgi:hypothetical protein
MGSARWYGTATGPIAVKVLKVRVRSGSRVKFNSLIVPPHVRKSPHVSAALPWLYLKGSEAICEAVRRPNARLVAGMFVDQLAVLLSLHLAREPAVRSGYGIWHRLSGRDPESGVDAVFPVDQRPRAIAGRLRRYVRYAWGLAVREHKSLAFSHEITRRPFRKRATRNVVTIQRPDAGGAAGTLEPAALIRDFLGPGLLGHLAR